MAHRSPQPREAAPTTPDVVVEVRDADLSAEVRPLIANVHAQIKQVTDRYGVGSIAALHEKLGSGSRKELFAARKDVEQLSRLTEKLEYLWKEHEQVERGFAMRREAQEVRTTAREYAGEGQTLPYTALCQFIEAELYVGSPSEDDLTWLAQTAEFDRQSNQQEVFSLLRALGKFGRADLVRILTDRVPEYSVQLRAMYIAGEGGEHQQENFDDIRASVRMEDGNMAYQQLFVIAAAERHAGLDNRSTLALIEGEVGGNTGWNGVHFGLGIEHARSGREGESRAHIEGSARKEEILFEIAKYSIEHDDIAHAERVLAEMDATSGAVRKLGQLLVPYRVRKGHWGHVHRYVEDQPTVVRILAEEDPALAEAYYKEETFAATLPESFESAMAIVRARNGERARPVERCKTLLGDIEKWRGGFIDPLRGMGWVGHKIIHPLCDYMVAMDALGEDTAEIMRAIKDAAEQTDASRIHKTHSIERVAKQGDIAGAIRLARYLFQGVYRDNDIRDQLNRDISAGAAKESLRLAKKSYEILQKAGV